MMNKQFKFPNNYYHCLISHIEMNQLRHNQKLIMQELKKIKQGSESEASKCKEAIDSMKKQSEHKQSTE